MYALQSASSSSLVSFRSHNAFHHPDLSSLPEAASLSVGGGGGGVAFARVVTKKLDMDVSQKVLHDHHELLMA